MVTNTIGVKNINSH